MYNRPIYMMHFMQSCRSAAAKNMMKVIEFVRNHKKCDCLNSNTLLQEFSLNLPGPQITWKWTIHCILCIVCTQTNREQNVIFVCIFASRVA